MASSLHLIEMDRSKTEVTMNLLIVMVVGLLAGWLAYALIDGHGLGSFGDLSLGIFGAFIATFIYSNLNINHSLAGAVTISILGSALFLVPVAIFSPHSHRRIL